MIPYKPLLAAGVAAIALAAPAFAKAPEPLVVTDGWVREAPPGMAMMGGYMRLQNPGTAPVVLTGVTSPLFGDIQMHQTVEVDGRMTMKHVPSFTIAPGATLEFKPGANHLMLMQPKRAIKVGEAVPVVLGYKGGSMPAVLVVRGRH